MQHPLRSQTGTGTGAGTSQGGADPRHSTASASASSAASHSFSQSTHRPGQAGMAGAGAGGASAVGLLWDPREKDADDWMHNPDPARDAKLDRSCDPFSIRGWLNMITIFVITAGLIVLFAGSVFFVISFFIFFQRLAFAHDIYELIGTLSYVRLSEYFQSSILIPAAHYRKSELKVSGYNLGGVNGSGQIPTLQNLPLLIDKDTDPAVYARTGHDGQKYSLVFSDEFQTPGRTFYPGDDPYFEAVSLHYWQTGDFEYYDPASVTTEDGFMKIELRQVPIRGLNFQSGMVQTWNKFCFQTGYLESVFCIFHFVFLS